MARSPFDVSVIVAVRNGAETLAQCIESVLGQTGCTVELLVVDGMSTDGTQGVIRLYADRIATYIREPDGGIYDAWNKALGVARGEWCAFLGADDHFSGDDSLAALLRTAREPGPVPVFVHGGILRVGGPEDFAVHPDPVDPRAFLRSGRMLPHQGFLHRVEALRAIGGFDTSYRILGDFDAALKLADIGGIRRCPEIVTHMRIGGLSNRWSTSRAIAREKFRALHSSVGLRVAVRHHLVTRWPQVAGRAVEQTVLRIFGRSRGIALLLNLRRRIGRPPKLI